MDADVDERAERGDVRDDARQFHSRFEIFDFFDAFLKIEDFKFFARIASRLRKFG